MLYWILLVILVSVASKKKYFGFEIDKVLYSISYGISQEILNGLIIDRKLVRKLNYVNHMKIKYCVYTICFTFRDNIMILYYFYI